MSWQVGLALERRFLGRKLPFLAFLRVGWDFSPSLPSAAENRPDPWGRRPGQNLGEAAGLRIRASEKRLAVAATITEGFRRNGTEKVHVRYGNAPYMGRFCVVETGQKRGALRQNPSREQTPRCGTIRSP